MKIKSKYWSAVLEDGTTLFIKGTKKPTWVTVFSWYTAQTRRTGGGIPGLGYFVEDDPTKPKLLNTYIVPYVRRKDAKAAADNYTPAIPTRRNSILAHTDINARKVIKIVSLSEIVDYKSQSVKARSYIRHNAMLVVKPSDIEQAAESKAKSVEWQESKRVRQQQRKDWQKQLRDARQERKNELKGTV